ncbi:MAG TPA: DUF3035 domain-containing protein [Alphaproteobacteria bacterium]|nr:DUF3035 domain-containing protein [Alphaproteobacteria bacterium]
MARLKPLGVIVVGALVLAGCSSAGRVFGLGRNAPDEFAVVSRAPLTLPPEFNLRPPQPGAPRPQEGTASQRAENVVFGQNGFGLGGMQAANVSRGEDALLAAAGAGAADPNIRQVVNQEATDLLVAEQSFIDRLLFWREPEEPGIVVDAEAEARRLQANAALGDPITEGEVPVIERRSRAPLEGLLNF